jgi:hypothetical protein
MKDIKTDSSIENEKKEKKLIEEKPKEEGNLLVKVYDGPEFGYLKRNNNDSKIYSKKEKEETNFKNLSGKYCYIIAIDIPLDTKENSQLLKATIDSIDNNINNLKKIGIESNDILLLLFFENIKSSNLFKTNDFVKDHTDDDYIYIECNCENNNMKEQCDVIALAKNNISGIIENLNIFYHNMIPDLIKKDEKDSFIYVSFLQCGINFKDNSLLILISTLNGKNKKGSYVAVPCIETIPEGLFSNILQYENIHFNIYDLNYYDMASSVPINSFFNVMKIDNSFIEDIKTFYKDKISINSSLYYHNYSMGIYLKNLNYDINYISYVSGYFFLKDIEYSYFMDLCVEKYSGYYANFFNLLHSFLNFNNCMPLKKTILFFQLIGMIIQLIFPSLSTMVIYSIFYECFNLSDGRTAIFFTIVYFCFLMLSGVTYKSVDSITKMKLISFFFFIFFELYYVFILISSIFAMNNINKNKNHDRYKFNKVAISLLIIFNFAFGILPLIFSLSKIIPNIKNMIMYLFLGAPSSNSVFLMASLFNSGHKSGGKKIEDQSGFFFLIFFTFNLFFEGLILFNTNRSSRVNAVLDLAILFTIYNFFKQLAIVLRILLVEKNFTEMNREKHYNEIKNLITSLKSDKPPPISPGTGNFEPEEEKKGDIGNFELENQGDNLNNFEENEDKKSNKNDDKKKYRETGNFEPNESNNNDKSGNSFEEEEV